MHAHAHCQAGLHQASQLHVLSLNVLWLACPSVKGYSKLGNCTPLGRPATVHVSSWAKVGVGSIQLRRETDLLLQKWLGHAGWLAVPLNGLPVPKQQADGSHKAQDHNTCIASKTATDLQS